MTCFDTNALIWAVEADPPAHVSNHCKRIRAYLQRLRDEQTPVMIPVPVLFEFLCKYPPEAHESVRTALAEGFVLFDTSPQVAGEGATLFRLGQATAQAAGTPPKQQRKMDVLVAASAVVAGAAEIISEDRDYAQLSGGRLKWRKVSDLPLPTPGLFDQSEPTPPEPQ